MLPPQKLGQTDRVFHFYDTSLQKDSANRMQYFRNSGREHCHQGKEEWDCYDT